MGAGRGCGGGRDKNKEFKVCHKENQGLLFSARSWWSVSNDDPPSEHRALSL